MIQLLSSLEDNLGQRFILKEKNLKSTIPFYDGYWANVEGAPVLDPRREGAPTYLTLLMILSQLAE